MSGTHDRRFRAPVDDLIIKALAVLDEEVEQLREDRDVPTTGLRFALAFLWAISNDEIEWCINDRQAFDQFWRAIVGEGPRHENPNTALIIRRSEAHGWLQMICRRVGVVPTIENSKLIARARGKPCRF